jgi:hypothetical protein
MAETPEHRAWIEEFIQRTETTFKHRTRIILQEVKGYLFFVFPSLNDSIMVHFELYHFKHDITVFIGEFERTPQFFDQLSQKLDNFDFGQHTDLRPDDLMMEELLTTDIEIDEHECYVCTNETSNSLPCGHIICKLCFYKQLTTNPRKRFACGICRQKVFADEDSE